MTTTDTNSGSLKVFGGYTFVNGKQVRAIVAARSLKRASDVIGIPYGRMREYWSKTANAAEIAWANAKPETPLYFKDTQDKSEPKERSK